MNEALTRELLDDLLDDPRDAVQDANERLFGGIHVCTSRTLLCAEQEQEDLDHGRDPDHEGSDCYGSCANDGPLERCRESSRLSFDVILAILVEVPIREH